MNKDKSTGAAALCLIIGAITWWFLDFKSGLIITIIAFVFVAVLTSKSNTAATNPAPSKPAFKNYWLKIEDFYDKPVDIKSDAGAYNDMFKFDVIGESNYQNALNKLMPTEVKQTDKHRVYYVANLEFEDDNEYDKNAIAVEINGMKVGYVPKEANKSIRKQLKAISQNKQSFSCHAAIIGGAGKYYGVWLNI